MCLILGRNEMTCIQEIVQLIFKELRRVPLDVAKYEVGIDSHVNELIKLLYDDGLKDVRIVGICGMGGIGKTTIAKAVFNQIFDQFENYCFLGDVRENSENRGLAYLQEQLLNEILKEKDMKIYNPDWGITMINNRLCRIKVLVVLDDVNELHQLEYLAGGHNWFGSGSKIIITTRDEHLLGVHKVDEIYKVEPLNCEDALELFSWHAFETTHPPEDYVKISCRVIDYAKGLPLALKVLGSLLHKRSIQQWESEINKLKKFPNRRIVDVLRISYDSLDDTEKYIFLDIACLFKGKELCDVIDLLTSSEFYPNIGISVLVQRSLITINKGIVCMHDLIQELGKEIVFQESPKDPGNRSRLWYHEDICKVLIENKVTNRIEGIMLNTSITKMLRVHADAFETMTNLRVLTINNVCLSGRLTKFSSQLIYVDWNGFPSSSLPINFHPEKLVQLHLRGSHIKQMWPSIKILNKLKILDLSESQCLKNTPDFSGLPSLESLNLDYCTSLVEVHPSIAFHERLIIWKMEGCKNLRSLPRSIKMKSLVFFSVRHCSKLKKFPEIEGEMSCLKSLRLDETAIKDFPGIVWKLPSLERLSFPDCKNLESIPNIVCNLRSLRLLDLSYSKIEEIPGIIGDMISLVNLNLSGLAIKDLPSSIEHLIGLQKLQLDNCKKIKSLPSNIYKMKSLRILSLRGCLKLEKFPDIARERKGLGLVLDFIETSTEQLPSIIQLSNLRLLVLSGCTGLLQLEESISGLRSLQSLCVNNCNLLEGSIPSCLGCLSSLQELNLCGNNFASLPGINQLTKLKRLFLDQCSRLQVLSSLPSSILYVSAPGCKSLERVSFPPSIDSPRRFILTHCPKFSLSESLLQETEETDFVVLSGSEIPEWFSSKSEGSSVSLWADPHCYSKLKAIAVCAVFKSDPEHNLNIPFDLKVNGYTTRLCDKLTSPSVHSDFVSGDVIQFQKKLFKPGPFPLIHDRCYIEASMTLDYMEPEVKRCGIHLVMKKQDENP
ncbi:hypothetical protein F0562_006414 [Nyssa sinensis]|uniref:ADP-ribosyl cyclase/cyclic ADP-ribose hydrolase n=1 Tax=Nyssa sinensis TaxID=561372 RepID=A0A5J5ANR0_9ASTE|nr:hypothetical protein F0562_006414 [Nyssa sinensis]